MARHERVKVPMVAVFQKHLWTVVVGTLISLSVFVNFYLMTVFTLSWGTTALGYTREQFLYIQLFGVLFFGATIPWAALRAERGRKPLLIAMNVATAAFGLVMAPMLDAGWIGAAATLALGMALIGIGYGPLGTVLAELFPTAVRYTGARSPTTSPGSSVRRWRLMPRRGWPPITVCASLATTCLVRPSSRSPGCSCHARQKTKCCNSTGL